MCSTELTEVMKKMKILICCILITVHYRVYKCIAILHTPVGRTHGENSMSKLDNDGKRVANIYMDLPSRHMLHGRRSPAGNPGNCLGRFLGLNKSINIRVHVIHFGSIRSRDCNGVESDK